MREDQEARAVIMNRIGARKSAGELADDYAAIPREYVRNGSLDQLARLDLLERRLREYDAGVYRCGRDRIPETIAQVLGARGKSRIAIAPGLPPAWLPEGIHFTPAGTLSVPELDRIDGVLSGCTVAIAITGTIVLQNALAQGARRFSLVPDYHLCVIDAGQVVETVPEAFAILEPTMLLPTTLISGPSATADIEMTRIKGVHGPRFLDVVLAS